MASGLSLALGKIKPRGQIKHVSAKYDEKGRRHGSGEAFVSGKDRSLHGKARVKARKAKNKIGGW